MNNTDVLSMSDEELVKIIRQNINSNVPTSQYSRAKNELELRDRERKFTTSVKSDSAKQEIQDSINKLKTLMVNVSTGISRIENENDSYTSLYTKSEKLYEILGLENPNPYSDLWEFYSYWSKNLPRYIDRRLYVSKLYKDSDKKKSIKQAKGIDDFVDKVRIEELLGIKSDKLDLRKLIRFCEEINSAYRNENYLSVTFLLRAILDHIPPVFGCSTFDQVCGNYGKKTFKDISAKLNESSRKLADSYLHDPIRKKETLPNRTQVNFSQELDYLLGEIISQF